MPVFATFVYISVVLTLNEISGSMRSIVFTLFLSTISLLASAQYIARLEPYPYTGTLSICAGGQITVRGNHIENLNNGSTISIRLIPIAADSGDAQLQAEYDLLRSYC